MVADDGQVDRRRARQHPRAAQDSDDRESAQKDRDRILYSSAFRRLAEVTQVVSPLEGHVFHNRLTHTLKVAQLARRIAERLLRQHPDEITPRHLDPEIAEAAALAHDLGHPPFGHIAEKELDRLVKAAGDPDGYEGNAQSFRIITRLSAHVGDYGGLNLTRASLNAVLKYPWFPGDGLRADKYGAYRSDSAAFDFARDGARGQEKSLEAEIMDLADSITYSVHDLFDFYQAGLVPLWELSDDLPEYIERFKTSNKVDPDQIEAHYDTLEKLATLLPGRAFRGTIEDRVLVRSQSSWLISEFVSTIALTKTDEGMTLTIPPDVEVKMRFLQSLVWNHVIASPALASQQMGQVRIIRELYQSLLASARGEGEHGLSIIPPAYAHVVWTLVDLADDERSLSEARLAADVVASLTEEQARRLHKRVMGLHQGSVLDHLGR